MARFLLQPRWTLWIGAIALLALAVSVLDLRPGRRGQPARVLASLSGEGPLLAGAARVRVELPAGVRLAGYRPLGREVTGDPRPTYARALVLEAGGVRTALVVLELLTVPAALAAAIDADARALGVPCTAVAATHTHSGPAGYDRDLAPQLAAVGRHDPRVESALRSAAASALAAAAESLAPARLSSGEAEATSLVASRDASGGPADARLTRVAIEHRRGSRVAEVIRLAAHPTLSRRSSPLSGDWPGRVMESIEQSGGVAMVLTGAVGDGAARAKKPRSRSFPPAVIEAARSVPMSPAGEQVALGCGQVELALPPPSAPPQVPDAVSTLASNLLVPFAPARARTTLLRLHDRLLVLVPAEVTSAAAREIESAIALPGAIPRVVSIGPGYVGYAPVAAEIEAGTGSSSYAWFGAELAERVAAAAAEAAAGMRGSGRP